MNHHALISCFPILLTVACASDKSNLSADAGDVACSACDANAPDSVPVHTVAVCHDGSAMYTGIQEAIDSEPAHTVIAVCSGTYYENLTIDGKPLTIRGDDKATTVIDGSAAGRVVDIRAVAAPGVVVDGITIRNGVTPTGGGGIGCAQSTLSLIQANLSTNEARHGGGLFATECTLNISATDFSQNRSDGRGGGALLLDSTGTLSNTVFTSNIAGEGGGLAIDMGTISVTGSEFQENEATTTEIFAGGGGLWFSGDQSVAGNQFNENYSSRLGGGVFLSFSSGDVTQNTFQSNEAANDGGGMVCVECTTKISFNDFHSNVAGDDAGGLRVMTSNTIIEDNTFTKNTAAKDGGAAKISHAKSEFRRNTLTDNTAVRNGGGLELDNDWSTVDDSTFTGNEAAHGGGLHSSLTESHSWITNSTFTNNTASNCGGALAIDDDPYEVHMIHLVISNNSANRGAGICADQSKFSILNSAILGNVSDQSGGALQLSRASGAIQNLVIVDNQAATGSAMRIIDSSDLGVSNNIIFQNSGASVISAVAPLPSWTFNNTYSNTGGTFAGLPDPTGTGGNISSDPLFQFDSYRLESGSPCINTGDPAVADTDGSRSDIGAYGGPENAW